jgi:hypothetical protein
MVRITHDTHTGVVNDWTANQIFSGKIYLEDAGGEHLEGNGSLLTITGATKFANTVYINETANSGVTLGLTINQGGNTDAIMELQASGVDHGMTSISDRNAFAQFRQSSGNYGGLTIRSMAEDDANDIVTQIYSSGGTAASAKTTSGYGLFDIYVTQHDGSNALDNLPSEGNVLSIRARYGGANVTRAIFDADGDFYSVTSAQTFDSYDDAALVRALEQTKGTTIRSEWDDFVKYNESDLINAKILGAPIADGGMTNVTQLQRLHNGAIWQSYVREKQLEQRVESLEGKLALLEGAK